MYVLLIYWLDRVVIHTIYHYFASNRQQWGLFKTWHGVHIPWTPLTYLSHLSNSWLWDNIYFKATNLSQIIMNPSTRLHRSTIIHPQLHGLLGTRLSSIIFPKQLHDSIYMWSCQHVYWLNHSNIKSQIDLVRSTCCPQQNHNWLHFLSWCTNKHINNLRTNRHNKVVHVVVVTFRAHPTTRHFTLISMWIMEILPSISSFPLGFFDVFAMPTML